MNQSKIIKGFILGVIAFFAVIFLSVVVVSYMPGNMIKLATDTKMEYFVANVLHNLGFKLIISTFISFIITGIGALIVFKFSSSNN